MTLFFLFIIRILSIEIDKKKLGKEKKNRCSYDQDCFSFGLDWIEKIIYFLVINYYNLYEYLGLIL